MKVYIRHKTIVYFIQFKNVKIALDEESCVFLGSIKNNEAKINKNVTNKLLKKFDKANWDDVFKNDLAHIKFLIEYSPILSKFVDPSEFNDIEFINLHSNIIDIWRQEDIYYIDFSKNVKFFNTEETEIDVDTKTLYINIDPKFSQILKSFER